MTTPLPLVLRRNLRQALARGELERAEEVLALLVEEDPTSRETRGFELELLIRARRFREAGAMAKELAELFPDSPRVRYLIGRLAYERRDYAGAATELRESCRLHPHWRSRHLLARSLTQMGELAEAERLLLELVDEHPHCERDLAWLYERKGEPERALRHAERHLERYPDDPLAESQRLRLSAGQLEADELVEEVESLLELGEAPPEALLPSYAETLLKLGRQSELRSFVAERRQDLPPRLAVKLGWVCYRLQVYDLALELFLIAFPEQCSNFKFLTALEAAASRCRRIEQLIPVYEAHAPQAKGLYGRLKRLQRRLEGA